ncbi:hypothetical protein L3Q82_014293 [Scortum barcoo]|uniref:Uncharacterized protein n=1 Tax=Scortum barcoo TaxID=214431 RepID=A0ACB8VWR9_9TELE|nr:hypothetical protein L3Q82_014293 [Scortum barcoo]
MHSPLHFTQPLPHLQLPNTYVRMLFVDFSSAFNTVIPDKLILKLHNLGLPSSLCHWIRDFLTNRPQVWASYRTSDETHYRERRSSTLLNGAQTTNLVLNTSKTKEVIVDYRRSRKDMEHAPLLIHGEAVERVNNIKFLGIHITSDLTLVHEHSSPDKLRVLSLLAVCQIGEVTGARNHQKTTQLAFSET